MYLLIIVEVGPFAAINRYQTGRTITQHLKRTVCGGIMIHKLFFNMWILQIKFLLRFQVKLYHDGAKNFKWDYCVTVNDVYIVLLVFSASLQIMSCKPLFQKGKLLYSLDEQSIHCEFVVQGKRTIFWIN